MKCQLSLFHSKFLENATMLLLLNITKLILPFVSLPYLTRVLSTDAYGTVAYVKSVIGYMQVLVDFGFILSSTKDIVASLDDKAELNKTVGNIFAARLLISTAAFLLLGVLLLVLPILRDCRLFAVLSFLPVFLSIFLFDFVFRGLEKMHVITIRYLVMKSISTVLIFFIIKKDSDIIKIPLIDSFSSLLAVFLVFANLKKEHINLRISAFSDILKKVHESFLYFLSSVAAQSFNALNTIVAGIFLAKTDIAFWSVSLQIIGAVQILYSPITDAIYPEMLRTKRISAIKKILCIFQPVVFIGCAVAWLLAEFGMKIVGGSQYVMAAPVFRLLIPVLFFSFPGMVLGWPALGAIGKVREVTISTVFSMIFQIMGLAVLVFFRRFSLVCIVVLRSIAEFVLLAIRFFYCMKFRDEFSR
ncbi:MAG: oligosaccharide flippase family protein [Treponema sp.]|nr:oligosaccharide flippase family protein [Treponema sp.]